jgi:surface polysaccharide O-acyltransferase-like enzyme
MLSGAFILSNEKNDDYKKFYSKSFCKIGVPTVIFSLLYILYRIPLCFLGEFSGVSELLVLVKDILKGSPMYHMWYLYMLIGVYAMVPIILRFKRSISEKTFYKVSFILLMWGV